MKKTFFLIFLILLILPGVLAINLNIEKISSEEVMILDLNKPAIFNLRITNLGSYDNFMFYTFFGSGIYPKGTVPIAQGQTKDIELGIYPREDLRQKGSVTFDYFIKGTTEEQEEKLTVRIIDLKEAFEVGSWEFDSGTDSIKVYIRNKVNFNFGEIKARFSSPFFNFEETFSLGQKETKEFTVGLNKEDFKKLLAGFYTLNAEVIIGDKKADIEGVIKFVEKDLLTTTEKKFGFVINTMAIKKVNEGNIISPSETLVKKNIISRLFTSFSPQPDFVERSGLAVYYTWTKEIKPGETLEIIVKTNWIFPFLIIFFVVTIVILVKLYSQTNLILKKRVTFVRAKGGEFALKVSVFVQARKYVERISIIDRLPPLVKIHERFGAEEPKRIDEKNKKIEWGFEKMEPGEVRVLSYIIYSKIGVLGKFALPQATAIYEREGKIQESYSNRAFFIAEQRQRKED